MKSEKFRVTFIGVGEAFDETLPNNSQLLEWPECRLLVDCGYAVPHMLWKLFPDPEYIDAVYLSHRHADHYFGLPSYLVRLEEDQRKSPLDILCPEGMQDVITEMIDYAYMGVLSKMNYEIRFVEVSDSEPLVYRAATMEFAVSSHPVKNFAIAVSYGDRKYAYSGDGNFNSHTRTIYRDGSLLVHEAYSLDEEVRGHAMIPEVLWMAKEENIQRLALTHLERNLRRNRRMEIDAVLKDAAVDVFLPEPGDQHEV